MLIFNFFNFFQTLFTLLICLRSPLLRVKERFNLFMFDTFYTSFTCFVDGLTTYPFFCSTINISFGYL
ncbi:unnamed protein product, partial [Vitis vinifera]